MPKTDESVRERSSGRNTRCPLRVSRSGTSRARSSRGSRSDAAPRTRSPTERPKESEEESNAPPRPGRMRGESVQEFTRHAACSRICPLLTGTSMCSRPRSCRSRVSAYALMETTDRQQHRRGRRRTATAAHAGARTAKSRSRASPRGGGRRDQVPIPRPPAHMGVVLQLGHDSALKFVSNNLGHPHEVVHARHVRALASEPRRRVPRTHHYTLPRSGISHSASHRPRRESRKPRGYGHQRGCRPGQFRTLITQR